MSARKLTEEEKRKFVGGVVATIKNNHIDGSGEPPNFDSQDFAYLSVFQNCFGEQLVFVQEHQEAGLGECYVRMGDAGWASQWPVKDGMVQGLVVDPPETTFILACWQAATRYDKFREVDKAAKKP